MVQLPITPLAEAPATTVHDQQPWSLENLQMIVVDDEPDSLEILTVLLEEAGAAVSAFSSPLEALQALAQSRFDLLISDIGMPNINGYTLISEVRATSPLNREIPAIALTAYAGERNQRRAIAAGYQAHIAKPINPQALLEVTSSLVTP